MLHMTLGAFTRGRKRGNTSEIKACLVCMSWNETEKVISQEGHEFILTTTNESTLLKKRLR